MAPSVKAVTDGLRGIVDAMRGLGESFALVGGLAVAARAEPRTTRDVDLAVASRDDDDAERIVGELQVHHDQIRTVLMQTHAERVATVRLVRADNPNVLVDLLFASCGIEREVVAAAEPVTIRGLTVPVAARAHLTLIAARGYGRARDLVALLEEAIAGGPL